MSYPQDLDEYSIHRLIDEINRRLESNKRGECDYCNRPRYSDPPCKEKVRHSPEYAERNRINFFVKMLISTTGAETICEVVSSDSSSTTYCTTTNLGYATRICLLLNLMGTDL